MGRKLPGMGQELDMYVKCDKIFFPALGFAGVLLSVTFEEDPGFVFLSGGLRQHLGGHGSDDGPVPREVFHGCVARSHREPEE